MLILRPLSCENILYARHDFFGVLIDLVHINSFIYITDSSEIDTGT